MTLAGLLVAVGTVVLAGCNGAPQYSGDAVADAGTPGATLLRTRCGRCHAPPLPAAHTAAEWAAVVHRMENHMMKLGIGQFNDSERRTLLDYLARNGRPA